MIRRPSPLKQKLLVLAVCATLMPVAQAADYSRNAGNFNAGTTAPNPLPSGDTLFGQAGSDKNFSSVAFTNQGTVAWQTNDRIGFVNSSVTNSALWDLQANANLTYVGGGASTFLTPAPSARAPVPAVRSSAATSTSPTAA